MITRIKDYVRLRKEAKIEKENRENIIRELPEFTNKIVLLMNAGLVLTQAVEILADNTSDTYFYREIRDIVTRMKNSNSSFSNEFREFSRKSGVRELLRLSNIITDNIEKGSELVEKLEQESSLMWSMSRKQVEERGRLAESKLTFPLAIMLISLIIVTAAPAFMIF